jgi:hypothetical protein
MAIWIDHYQPERHYMRGPGPKWLEKHAGISGPVAATNESSRKPSTLFRSFELRLRKWLPMQSRIGRKSRHGLQWSLIDQLGGWSV